MAHPHFRKLAARFRQRGPAGADSLADRLQELLAFNDRIFATSPVGILVYVGATGKCILANRAAARILSASPEALLHQDFRRIVSWEGAGMVAAAEEVLRTGHDHQMDAHFVSTFGREVWLDCQFSMFLNGGEPHLLLLIHDDTSRKLAEAALASRRKMESLGLMAGGIAHDFNNLFQSILANLEMAREGLARPDRARAALDRAQSALERSSLLSQRMLDYSGKGFRRSLSLDLTRLVSEGRDTLLQLLPPHAILDLQLQGTLPEVLGDPDQILQALGNLVENAGEALETGSGTITVATLSRRLEARELQGACWVERPEPGEAVCLAVIDPGMGMSDEILNRAFDPFFTTKAPGRGLGLSAALGILKGHGAGVEVERRPGGGTVFRIWFPVRGGEGNSPAEASGAALPRGKAVRILLVDDDDALRSSLEEVLREILGFEVLSAADGDEAVALFRQRGREVDLVLMDATMPGMTGAQAFGAMRSLRPDLRGLLCSGFSEQMGNETAQAHGFRGFLKKPFSIRALREAIEEALGTG